MFCFVLFFGVINENVNQLNVIFIYLCNILMCACRGSVVLNDDAVCHVTLLFWSESMCISPFLVDKMARNEEKQQGRLNRLWLQKETAGKSL